MYLDEAESLTVFRVHLGAWGLSQPPCSLEYYDDTSKLRHVSKGVIGTAHLALNSALDLVLSKMKSPIIHPFRLTFPEDMKVVWCNRREGKYRLPA